MVGEAESGSVKGKLEAAWQLLGQHGLSTAVAAIRERLESEVAAAPVVVVVGESQRGKSSLINALVGTPVAPAGIDVVTGAYVTYVPASIDNDVPVGTGRVLFADESAQDVPLEDLSDWVTLAGQHVADERGVVGATVRTSFDTPLDLVLVDTPGVGGLASGHGDVALRVAQQATALLFVTDAGGDLTAPEVAFLEQAAATVDTVVLAITKIDKHPTSWQTIVDRDRALLAHHAPRFGNAPLVGVSSTMAVDASMADDPLIGAALREGSRIDQLIDVLHSLVSARSEQLATVNALRGTTTALERTASLLTERIAAIMDAETTSRHATSEQDELQALRRHQRRWGREFDLEMHRQRRALVETLGLRMPELEQAWRTRVVNLTPSELRSEPLQRELLTTFSGDAVRLCASMLDSYVDGVAGQVQAVLEQDRKQAAALTDHVQRLVAPGSAVLPNTDLPPAPAPSRSEFLMRSLPGVGLARMFTFAGLPAWLPLPLPLVFGAAGLATAVIFQQRTQAEAVRAQLREHVARTVQRAQSVVLQQADAITSELRPLLLDAMEEYIDGRIAELSQIIKEAQQAARTEPMERAKQLQPLRRSLTAVVEAGTDLEVVLRQMVAGTSQPFGDSNEQDVSQDTASG